MDFFIGKQALKNLGLPPTGPLILVILGLALLYFTRLRRSGAALCAAGLLTLWLLATPIIADVLVRAGEPYPALDLQRMPQADAIVVLAGGVRYPAMEYHTAAPSMLTLQRLAYGALVARAAHLPVLVSGADQEALAMRHSLQRDFGVQVQWVESHSRNTQQNAQLSAVLLKSAGVATIVLVTSATHMRRAAAEFRALGFTVIPAPTGMWTQQEWQLQRWVPSADALWRSQSALYEDLGSVVQGLRMHSAAREVHQ